MDLQKDFPSVAKYMGSKTEVLDLIEKGINYFDFDHPWICDLFAGSATLSGALRNKSNIISNDIQCYSEVFANAYLNNYDWGQYPDISVVVDKASERANSFMLRYKSYTEMFRYDRDFSLDEFNELEQRERALIDITDWNKFDDYYLFTQNYSGTYWGFEQCVWIDSYRAVIDNYKDDSAFYNLLLTCLIYSMAYNSQSTGHYAQYRIPETESSKDDILIYRRKSISEFFIRKYEEFRQFLNNDNRFRFVTMTKTDEECLALIPQGSLVYADPPYCFVHYSRFYHVLETLVRYDYPQIKYKGRYRDDRYQSEYCIKSLVTDAFERMFRGIRNSQSDMILSYTNSSTNTICFSDLLHVCCNTFNQGIISDSVYKRSLERCNDFFDNDLIEEIRVLSQSDVNQRLKYEIAMIKKPYNHSRMGRTITKTIPVIEIIIIAKRLY